jgi:hypothetical protein
VKQLSNIVPITDKMNATTGVDRRVHHMGSFTGASQPSDTQNKNKTALCVTSASVNPLFYRAVQLQADVHLQKIISL